MAVSFRPVPDFDKKPLEEATRILYEELIPACEAKRIKLSSYGNHASQGSLQSVKKYEEKKTAHNLFNVARVQKAFAAVDIIFEPKSAYQAGSYSLKHVVESHPLQNEYISNGDFIAAMLLKGHKGRFKRPRESVSVNCDFKVREPGK